MFWDATWNDLYLGLGIFVILAIFVLVVWCAVVEAREDKQQKLEEELRRKAERDLLR